MSENKEYQGVVLWFDPQKGYGFIKQDHTDEDIFLHFTNIQVNGFKTVKPNQKVTYEVGENHRGQQAVNVVVGEMTEGAEVEGESNG
jgi:CspA family cold shock protein